MIERKRITTKFSKAFGIFKSSERDSPFSQSSWDSLDGVVGGSGGYNYLLFPHLTRCCSLLRTVLLKQYVFRPYYFSFVVWPSVLDGLPPLVVVVSSSSCPDLLRVFNYIVRVSKIVAYLL